MFLALIFTDVSRSVEIRKTMLSVERSDMMRAENIYLFIYIVIYCKLSDVYNAHCFWTRCTRPDC